MPHIRDVDWEALFERLDGIDVRPSLEAPSAFDFAKANERFRVFAHALEGELGSTLHVETGYGIQDATFHSAVQLVNHGPQAEGIWILFSNFGDLASIRHDDQVPPELMATVLRLLEAHGYVYVPYRVLARPYPRSATTGFREWWNRFFDYT